MIRQLWLACAFLLCTLAPALAQNTVFIQIEANRSLTTSTERARAYAPLVDNIVGFALGNTWYAVAAGPYDPATAATEMARLKAAGLIPRDAYIAQARVYRDQFWPIGGGALSTPPVPAAPTPATPAPPTTPLAVEITPEPVVEPEETVQQARRSESRLTRAERRELQTALQWFGFYTSTIDGAIGPGTRRSMEAYQEARALPVTGVLTAKQRAQLLQEFEEAQSRLGMALLTDDIAGIEILAPLGLVAFDRHEAPFVHYEEAGGSGVRMILISQPGDRSTMNGLYEILQTLADVPPEGPRAKKRSSFSITGQSEAFTSETRVKLRDGHIHGFMLIWPLAQNETIGRVLPDMERTLRAVGAPMPLNYGFDPSQQSLDLVAGLEVRKPKFSRSGFFVDGRGRVLTTAEVDQSCTRLTIDKVHDAKVIHTDTASGLAILEPLAPLAPMSTARFAPGEGRLRAPVSVAGFPYQGVLGAASLTFGSLQAIRGLNGEEDVLRLSLTSEEGDKGGPILDETGAVAGMLLPFDAGGRVLPQDVAFARKAASMVSVLQDKGLTAEIAADSVPLPPEDLTLRAAEITVLVSCW